MLKFVCEATKPKFRILGFSLVFVTTKQGVRVLWLFGYLLKKPCLIQELERSKLVQSDERTIYEVMIMSKELVAVDRMIIEKLVYWFSVLKVQQGREPLDVDFCSITIDGSLDNDILPQRLHNVAQQREELQRMEIELRAQLIARSEVMEMQNSFDAQIKEHANAAVKLQVYVKAFSPISAFFKSLRRYSYLRITKSYFRSEHALHLPVPRLRFKFGYFVLFLTSMRTCIHWLCRSNFMKGKRPYMNWKGGWKRKIGSYMKSN